MSNATITRHAAGLEGLAEAAAALGVAEAPARLEPLEVWAVIYLRLSDLRHEESLAGREETMRAYAARLGVRVAAVIVENDLAPGAAEGNLRPASAFKRRKITLPNGDIALRTVRPGFRKVLEMIKPAARTGVTMVLVEDLDRLLRQPRDGEDLLDGVEMAGANVRSLSGSLNLTNGGTPDERFMCRMLANVANKSSADTARRVTAARARYRGQSYGGGRRPYGFTPDPKSAKYHRTLLIVDAEAEVLTTAAADLLDRGLSLRVIAAGLRAAAVPTVTGTAWTSLGIREVLLKPAIAGLVPDGIGGYLTAPWPAIIPRERWERLRDFLTDSRRTTVTGNIPRWLVSVFAECGTCGKPVRANGSARRGAPRYIGAECGHVGRVIGDAGQLEGPPAGVDEFIAQLVVARLGEPDAADLMRPATAAHVNAPKLRAEARKLAERKRSLVQMHVRGDLDADDLLAGRRAIAERLEEIDRLLATADAPDPLAEFRGNPAAEVWAAASMARRRAIVQLLISRIRIMPVKRGAHFNPSAIEVTWR